MGLVYFLNGPGANLYGLDRAGTYGSDSFETLRERCMARARMAGLRLDFRQSNSEGELIGWVEEAGECADGLIINGAGLTYGSVALFDALALCEKPVIEVHMSNIWKREALRHRSLISKTAKGVIAGLGVDGYELAVEAMARLVEAGQDK